MAKGYTANEADLYGVSLSKSRLGECQRRFINIKATGQGRKKLYLLMIIRFWHHLGIKEEGGFVAGCKNACLVGHMSRACCSPPSPYTYKHRGLRYKVCKTCPSTIAIYAHMQPQSHLPQHPLFLQHPSSSQMSFQSSRSFQMQFTDLLPMLSSR